MSSSFTTDGQESRTRKTHVTTILWKKFRKRVPSTNALLNLWGFKVLVLSYLNKDR